MAPQTKPVRKFRRKGIEAAIWENLTKDNKVRFTVTLSKQYTVGDQWKTTSSLDWDDLQRARKVLDRADNWIDAQYDKDAIDETQE